MKFLFLLLVVSEQGQMVAGRPDAEAVLADFFAVIEGTPPSETRSSALRLRGELEKSIACGGGGDFGGAAVEHTCHDSSGATKTAVFRSRQPCCFSIGFAAYMKPCCLRTQLLAPGASSCPATPDAAGGASGSAEACPASAEEAHQIIFGKRPSASLATAVNTARDAGKQVCFCVDYPKPGSDTPKNATVVEETARALLALQEECGAVKEQAMCVGKCTWGSSAAGHMAQSYPQVSGSGSAGSYSAGDPLSGTKCVPRAIAKYKLVATYAGIATLSKVGIGAVSCPHYTAAGEAACSAQPGCKSKFEDGAYSECEGASTAVLAAAGVKIEDVRYFREAFYYGDICTQRNPEDKTACEAPVLGRAACQLFSGAELHEALPTIWPAEGIDKLCGLTSELQFDVLVAKRSTMTSRTPLGELVAAHLTCEEGSSTQSTCSGKCEWRRDKCRLGGHEGMRFEILDGVRKHGCESEKTAAACNSLSDCHYDERNRECATNDDAGAHSGI